VSYFSYGWTQECLNSIFKFIPDCKILLIDNNPSKFDDINRKKSFANCLDSKDKILRSHNLCELERKWFSSKSNIIVLKTEKRLDHGRAINLAAKWCWDNDIPIMIHLEPDCVITGKIWIENLLNALDNNYWMASGHQYPDGSLHITPSAWLIKKSFQLNFDWAMKNKDLEDPIYPVVCDVSKTEGWHRIGWDVGFKAWFEIAKLNKAKHIDAPDFIHFWGKSSQLFCVSHIKLL
jgi:GT2 family glycosyltransferase